MMDEQKNQSGGEKTPEQQLAELLQQNQHKPALTRGMGVNLNFPSRVPRKQTKINWLAIGISLLALVLVFGTGYFLLTGLKSNTGELTLELNESAVRLKISDKLVGTIDTNYMVTLRAGEHKLVLAKDGFLELERTVTIVRGDKMLMSFQMLPIPTINKLVDGNIAYARLNHSGAEVSYLDMNDRVFKSASTGENKIATLFRGSFDNVSSVVWSPVSQAAIVKLAGQPRLKNMQDNRGVRGRYVVLGERPTQGAVKYMGTSTWLFDDGLKTASGWQPIVLNDSIRQVAYSDDGAEIVYIYDTADGEYSLVRALPGGEEWERVIVDLPQLDRVKLLWGADGRYLLIEHSDKLLLADLVAKSISEIAQDRVSGGRYAMSQDGANVAYVADVGGQSRLKVFELATGAVKVIDKAETVSNGGVFAWLSENNILLVAPNQTFVRINVTNNDRTIIPFVGQETNLQISAMEYSPAGQVLMLTTTTGIFVMKI